MIRVISGGRSCARACFRASAKRWSERQTLDVALHFVDKALRHRDLALAEDARHAQDQPVLGWQAVVQYAELLEQRIVLGRHLGELRPPLLRLGAMSRIHACLDLLLEPRELQLDGLHVVEDLLGEPARTLELDVLVDANADGYQQQPEHAGDHRSVAALLLALDGAEGAADHHRAMAGGSAGLRVEIMRDDFLHRPWRRSVGERSRRRSGVARSMLAPAVPSRTVQRAGSTAS